MLAHRSSQSASLAPTEHGLVMAWWVGLQQHMRQIQAGLPPGLAGVLQIQIRQDDGERILFFIEVDRKGANAGTGFHPNATTWLYASESDLAMLMLEEPHLTAMTVSGDHAFVRDLFGTFERCGTTQSWISVRRS